MYLQELISSHPDAHCYGEVLLGMDGPTAVGFPGPLARQRLLRHAWQHVLSGSALRPQRVLRRAVDSPETGVAGVRVMYNQVNRRVMRFMEDLSVSVIHVRRANILQQYVSLTQMRERQRTLGASSAHSRAPVTFAPTIVKPQLALEFVQRRDAEQTRFAAWCDARASMSIWYESDIMGISAERAGAQVDDEPLDLRIQGFLGLDRRELKSDTVKTGGRTVAQSVGNFEDLSRAFIGTPYAWMLE
ncbi:hypothetical protein [Aeromicrobium sp. Sec7.5]|uniref:hypothetical protein n=1 Tax=Aeromicrobium sp. Sec7.5 TaxID=3121276 RepID=UPI002FE47401